MFLRCGIGLDGVVWSTVSINYSAECVTESSGDRIGIFVWDRKSSILLETLFDAVLVI